VYEVVSDACTGRLFVLLDDGDRASEQWSEQRRGRVDDAVDGLLADERARAADALTKNRALLDELVALLLERRVLDGATLSTLRPTQATLSIGR
jgi:ATP-dependent Zn protease